MPSPLRVVHFGLGPIGLEVVRVVARRRGIVSVAAVDVDPNCAGRALAEVAQVSTSKSITVRSSLEAALADSPADVALHCTGSSLSAVRPQLEELMRAGLNVVSSCEELSYPVGERRGIAAELDAIAGSHGVCLLATGINPGFAMDALPIFLTAVCQDVASIKVKRVNDAGKRRLPLQRKVGAGLDESEFQHLVEAGAVRHVGLRESLEMIADAMGWNLERVEEKTSPVLALERRTTAYLTVEPGRVAGVRQVGTGYVDGRAAILLELEMYVGAQPERDEVWIEGQPSLHVSCDTGYPGDVTTAGILVNAACRLPGFAPGLHTMKDLLPVHYCSR